MTRGLPPLERVRDYRRRSAGAVDDEFLVLAAPANAMPAVPPGVEIVLVDRRSPLADIRENLDVNERGFDPAAAPVTDAQAEAFRPQLAGARAVTVRAGGTAVAAGMVLPVHAGVAELAGIATLAAYRRRGYGRLVTAVLVATAYRMGADLVMLSSTDPATRRIYTAVGFAPPRGQPR